MKRYPVLLALVACMACTGYHDGIGVNVWITSETLPLKTREDVTVSSGYVSIVGFTLLPCASLARTLWRALNPLPAAIAHSESSPLHLGVPVVIGLVGDRAPIGVGHLEPPPGEYCGVTVHVGPADADAVALPGEQMVGQSVRVSGLEGDTSFAVSSATSDSIDVQIRKITLDATHTNATLDVAVGNVLDDVEFLVPTAGDDVIARLHQTLSITVP